MAIVCLATVFALAPETSMKFFAQDIPNEPGVYLFRNAAGTVIYVGKAKSLRRRLSSYFQASRRATADPKLRALIHSIDAWEYFTVRSESEALVLEDRLVKQYDPRYNVDLRDDKRYLHVVFDLDEKYPRLHLVRMRRDDNRLWFGPFPNAAVLRGLCEWLSRHYGLRTCKVPCPDAETAKHCMEVALGTCPCPCLGRIDAGEYRGRVEAVLGVFRGNYREVQAKLHAEMNQAAAGLDFETAARLRDIVDRLPEICDPARRSFRNWSLQNTAGTPGPGLAELQAALMLPEPPAVIECLDMSHLGGTMAVGSVVCFRQGRPATADYRRFRIRSEDATDDTARMTEVVTRRYGRLQKEERPLPDLIVVDGGKPQLNAAVAALRTLGLGHLKIIALAKRLEEIFIPAETIPLLLPRDNPALKLLQAIRDEAHRFAVSYNRDLRRRRITESVLDEIPGIGPRRRLELMKAFGTDAKIRQAAPAVIVEKVPGIDPDLAAAVVEYLARH